MKNGMSKERDRIAYTKHVLQNSPMLNLFLHHVTRLNYFIALRWHVGKDLWGELKLKYEQREK